jgi:hypothetical protein
MRNLLKLEPGWYKGEKVFIVEIKLNGNLIIKKQNLHPFKTKKTVKKYLTLIHKLFNWCYWEEEMELVNSLTIPSNEFKRERKKK